MLGLDWKVHVLYEGDIGYVKEGAESDVVMLVAPHWLPYDLPEEPGERTMFDVELARITGCNVMPILSHSGAEAGYICNGCKFLHGLLRLTLPTNTLEIVELQHPNNIRFYMAAGIDLHLHELHRVFSLGDTLEVIAGPFCRETGYIVALPEHTIILVVMQPDKTPKEIEVSKFAMWSHLQDHVLSFSPKVTEPHLVPLAGNEALPVARGQWSHPQGIVKAVDLIEASLDIMHLEDGIQCPHYVCPQIQGAFWPWIIKPSAPNSTLRTGMLLDSTLLPPQLQHSLKSLHNWSFITPVVPHNATPPPSPGPSNIDPLGAWSIMPDDIIQTQTLDYSFSFSFLCEVCPDKFVGQNGPVPSGSVCITVMGHNTGLAIQHLTIPAQYPMPANPTGKNQLCPVLKGPQAGRVIHIMKCQRNSKLVVTEDVRGLNIYEDNDSY
ncbi:hypothetical protein EDD16DRAFT_1521167 [Pisolithus croceorrhizus]|nr:hypothetical protein EDD16DRAFT_1521167 [Pisolithus croceorrhizus]KAI6134294.1 hypothetical protein EV401DRAFT_1882827 [Pisolithus croceorrhizus]KAI6146574.1 hypothetical protein EDD17DRAFT_1514782 [Pisolithus thermaeus]